MRVLGGRIVLVEGEASRETQSGGEAWPNVARVIRQAHPLTIMTIDRDHPPDPTYLSKLPRAAGERGRLTAWSHVLLSPLQHSERELDRDSGWAREGQVRWVRERR